MPSPSPRRRYDDTITANPKLLRCARPRKQPERNGSCADLDRSSRRPGRLTLASRRHAPRCARGFRPTAGHRCRRRTSAMVENQRRSVARDGWRGCAASVVVTRVTEIRALLQVKLHPAPRARRSPPCAAITLRACSNGQTLRQEPRKWRPGLTSRPNVTPRQRHVVHFVNQ